MTESLNQIIKCLILKNIPQNFRKSKNYHKFAQKKTKSEEMEIGQGKLRIKDIAERAGVSVGTVDRVIHGRSSVSKRSREKVERVLEEFDYVPNHYASALASNKTYRFAAILPMHKEDSYWARVEKGLHEGAKRFSDFKMTFQVFNYDQFNDKSFEEQCKELLNWDPYAIVIGPIFNHSMMAKFVRKLRARDIPFSLLDSYWPEFEPVTFYGQDSKRSGEFSARIILMAAQGAKKIALFKLMGEGRVASRQQLDREAGFRAYVKEHSPQTQIVEQILFAYDKQGMKELLTSFFNKHNDITVGLSFNSSIHVISNFLKDEMPDRPKMTLLGYDAIDPNIECVRNGGVDFLIGQHPQNQGLDCFRSLFNACVLHTKQKVVHYVTIELITKENLDFYKD